MRKLIPLSLVVLLVTPFVFAQAVTLTSPIVRPSGTQYKIRGFQVVNPPGGAAGASIDISVQDASNNEIATIGFQIPDISHATATVPALISAMMTVRSGETGSDSRKMQFRVLGYFFDQGYFPAGSTAP